VSNPYSPGAGTPPPELAGRDALITKGLIFSPHHGEIAFTVPLFDAFMKRIMPGIPAAEAL
jgi:hypothetical protein